MKPFWIYYQKEMLEASRTYKWIWVPAVFLLLGIMQPVSTYYLPEILTMSGEVPPEAAALFTIPSADSVMASTLSQFSTIGLLVLVLAWMNTVAGERATGTAELVLTRTVSTLPMMGAKWAAMMTLMLVSFALGLAGAAYYTHQLIGPLEWGAVASGGLLYAVWLAWIVTLVLPLGAVLRGPAAAFISLGTAAALSLLSGLLPSRFQWSPGRLSSMAAEWMLGAGAGAWAPVIAALLIMLLSIIAAAGLLRRSPLSPQS
ncbi:hypothetical protein PVOR_29863 [Paenibacillus vortex V453]|uniref:ABC transporter permease n=1 Tax=Paenibacillus vortex V453 TaxID=715225 RepID=A0A2R9SMB5_9BACL|nr:hypothetical protein [Paenibacillus vortex]EFU38514.1 hypothetical protein PVOR_29863 [Paenibacillus vortex V453]